MNVPRPHDSSRPDGDSARRAPLAPGGFADELGERSLSFNHATETLVETLRLRREFADAPAFESALRARVDRVGRLPHPAFATIQSVARHETGLLLVSAYASGRRLSELTPIDHGFALALDVIRRITPALAALHAAGAGIGHGALSLNRLVMTRDKRLIVVEHVLAPALESLHWSRPHFNDVGLVVPDAVPVRLDARTDLRQLGWIVLSLLVGRTLPASEYPAQVRALLAEARELHTPLKTTQFGVWLERSLQIGHEPFTSALEAQAAFNEMAGDTALVAAESAGALLAFPSEQPAAPEVPVPSRLSARENPLTPGLETRSSDPAPPPVVEPQLLKTQAPPEFKAPTKTTARWIAGALGAIATAEALAIGVLLMRPAVVVQAPPRLEAGPPTVAPATWSMAPLAAGPATPASTSNDPGNVTTDGVARTVLKATSGAPLPSAASSGTVAAPAQRVGGFTVSAPIELEVFKSGTLVGSTAGPVAIGEGRHTLEFVNQMLGFRVTQVVTVSSGQLTPVRIAVPNGSLFVNAVPWAEITIDGVAAGQTPLGNLSLPIGRHQVVFRHPDLGERMQTVLVRADTPTRVTENFK